MLAWRFIAPAECSSWCRCRGCECINRHRGASVYKNKPTISGRVQFGLADSRNGYLLQFTVCNEWTWQVSVDFRCVLYCTGVKVMFRSSKTFRLQKNFTGGDACTNISKSGKWKQKEKQDFESTAVLVQQWPHRRRPNFQFPNGSLMGHRWWISSTQFASSASVLVPKYLCSEVKHKRVEVRFGWWARWTFFRSLRLLTDQKLTFALTVTTIFP